MRFRPTNFFDSCLPAPAAVAAIAAALAFLFSLLHFVLEGLIFTPEHLCEVRGDLLNGLEVPSYALDLSAFPLDCLLVGRLVLESRLLQLGQAILAVLGSSGRCPPAPVKAVAASTRYWNSCRPTSGTTYLPRRVGSTDRQEFFVCTEQAARDMGIPESLFTEGRLQVRQP